VHCCNANDVCCAVYFRFIVFRPFVGEVLVGTLTSSSSDGLHGKNVILAVVTVTECIFAMNFAHIFTTVLALSGQK